MAKLSDVGVRGTSIGVLLPHRYHFESEWLHEKRCNLIRAGKMHEADLVKQLLLEFNAQFAKLFADGQLDEGDFKFD